MQIFRHTIAWDGGVEIGRTRQIASRLRVEAAVPGQCAGDLADAIGTEVEADTGIFVAYGGQGFASIVHTDEGHDEFVGHVLVVRGFYTLHRVYVLAAFPIAENHRIEGFGNTLPAAVAIHGVVAAVH